MEYQFTEKQKKYLPVKRALDIAIAGTASILLTPVMAGLAVAIKLDSPGPVLFKQKRVGKDKKLFEIWKFRTMRTDTPKDVPTHMLSDPEAYITKTGRFMRKYSLDELPQLYQCVLGQMSLIGPRPALWNQYDLIAERDKYGANALTPGLTGWAQINGRDELEIPVKARFDGEYLQKFGPLMDLKCFLGTIGSVLRSDGVVEGGTGSLHADNSEAVVGMAKEEEPVTNNCAISRKKRVLVLGSVASMIDQFTLPNIELLMHMGYEVDVACNFKEGNTCSDEEVRQLIRRLKKMKVRYFHVDFARDVTKLSQNGKAFRQVKRLLKKNDYAFLHCHTPIGGVVGRIAGKLTGTKVIYTAHGFHFYKGAPLLNWILYFPVEWLCAYWTDVLITINTEDYRFAKKWMKAKTVKYIPGIGVDVCKFQGNSVDKAAKRIEIGVPEDAVMLFSVGELNENKNHETVIRALRGMNVYYVIAGRGNKEEELKKLAQSLGMSDRVKLLGFRTDIGELDKAADAFVFPSYREGLSVSLMEAMASGLPCAVSRIRGNTDLIDEEGGELFDPHDVSQVRAAVRTLLQRDLETMGAYNAHKVRNFSTQKVLRRLEKIYAAVD